MKDAQTNDPVSRPYKVVTEVESHACPSCHQDAPGHIVVGPDDIGFGTTHYGDEGKDEADDLADMLNDAYELGHAERSADEIERLRAALVKSVEVIQTWHNMDVPQKQRSELWDIYWRNAPELKQIREALTALEHGK